MRFLLLAILCASCGGKKSTAPAPAPPSATAAYTCDTVADNVARVMQFDRAEILAECRREELAPEDLRCFSEGKDSDALRVCAEAREQRIIREEGGGEETERPSGRETEARVGLTQLGKLLLMYRVEMGRYPATPAEVTAPPVGTCCKQGGTCAPDPTIWSGVWEEIRFSQDDEFRYSYRYVSDGMNFTAQAIGDLDCDGVYGTYELIGTLSNLGEITATDPFE